MNGLHTIFRRWLSRCSLRVIYSGITLFTLLSGLTIVLFLSGVPFVRGFLSDVVVVIFMFFFVKTFVPRMNRRPLALFVLLFAFLIEGLQYIHLGDALHATGILKVILGATFDWLDLLAYCMGTLISYVVDHRLGRTDLNSLNKYFHS